MVMRIGLNAHLLSLGSNYRSAGVSRYIRNLLAFLPQVEQQLKPETSTAYVAFVGDRRIRFAGWDMRPSLWSTRRPQARILWEQAMQPWRAHRAGLDLLHAPVYVGPLLAPCPLVVTIHDLSFYLYPELFPPMNRLYLQEATKRTVKKAAAVIADSESTARDIKSVLGAPQDRITVIPAGVGREMRPLHDPRRIEMFRASHNLPKRFILFLGTLEPRKNIPVLLEAYARFVSRCSYEHRLVLVGGKGWYYNTIATAIDKLDLRNRVLLPGYVPEQELPLWYNAADLFVYPSLYEGFGLPPLEAMACGTPVIVSNASSLPEVVGAAGSVVEANDATALAQAMEQLLDDEDLRQQRIGAGLERARTYSWRTTALRTCELYHELLGD